MLFNSFEFLLGFLPVTLFVFYFFGPKLKSPFTGLWLLVCSLFFYGWWNPAYLALILFSIGFNYFISKRIYPGKKKTLAFGITVNLLGIVFFKYTDFLIYNLNFIPDLSFGYLNLVLPLGISFYTFQQIAYLVDSYKGTQKEKSLFSYGLFVSFFPQLIAGPIVHHSEMMGQFRKPNLTKPNYDNLSRGLFIFMMGLAKKIVIADSFAIIANKGYANINSLGSVEAWASSLAYSLQLYFDFSGYSAMAIGLGLLFNIRLPQNFNSPYKSLSIKEFWRNWHMTLSRFLRDYVYIPLGGNKNGNFRTSINLVVTFLLGGIWHGAGWTFIFWGGVHGIALVIHREWTKLGLNLPKVLALLLTFMFVNITWVFFRAESWSGSLEMLQRMFFKVPGEEGFYLVSNFYDLPVWIAGVILLFMPNAIELGRRLKPTFTYLILNILLFLLNVIYLNSIVKNDFLYFDF
ncbi:MBOAT family O-acyltransferase [Cyclobacterium marinum]|uniref:MBOAT family O-acyltransferase n=1 Tax=Cyclobacterium marinum TaxID=104 RepID=UPI0011EC60D1|nr:MBOAT family protein [Cyclobacterium marinum]MBI0399109.1 MBOAT family protein [Cyclobacterium marinum]